MFPSNCDHQHGSYNSPHVFEAKPAKKTPFFKVNHGKLARNCEFFHENHPAPCQVAAAPPEAPLARPGAAAVPHATRRSHSAAWRQGPPGDRERSRNVCRSKNGGEWLMVNG